MREQIFFYKEVPAVEKPRTLFWKLIQFLSYKKRKERKPVVELVSTIPLEAGQKLFEFEISTQKISVVKFTQEKKHLLIKSGFLYAPGVREKNAMDKFSKMLPKKILSNVSA